MTIKAIEAWRAFLDWTLKIAVLAAMAFTAVQSVVVPRGLYADGAYNLWQVLNEGSFKIIGPGRSFAIVLNQLPVVAALKLGVHNTDVLIGFYTFGVAAVPVLIWMAALLVQLRERFFWPLVAIYAVTFLNSGFIAIGEYNYAFALVALSLSILLARRPVTRLRGGVLVFSAVALILCYEGMVVLSLPLIVVTLIRMKRPSWLGFGALESKERAILWCALSGFSLAFLIAAVVIGVRSLNAGDTNLADALNWRFPFDMNRQWRFSASLAILLALTGFIRQSVLAPIARLAVVGASSVLFINTFWSPAWLHYNTRSLATYTYFVLVVLLVAVAIVRRRVVDHERVSGAGGSDPLRSSTFALAAAVLFFSLSSAFWSMNAGYGVWLNDFKAVVIAGDGPIEITSTDLYLPECRQYSWGWTNPYLSALEQTAYGQGVVLSHVDSLETYTGIDPAITPEFFRNYYRTGVHP